MSEPSCYTVYTVFCSSLPLASVLGVTFKLKGICVALHGMIYEKEVSYLINCKSLSQFYFPFLAFISIDREGSKTRHMGGVKSFHTVTLMKVQISACDFESLNSIHLQMCVSGASTLAFQDVICLFILGLSGNVAC